MLCLQELITLINLLVILYGIHIYVTKLLYLALYGRNLLFQHCGIRKLTVLKACGKIIGKLIFLPHIIVQIFTLLGKPFDCRINLKCRFIKSIYLLRNLCKPLLLNADNPVIFLQNTLKLLYFFCKGFHFI